MYNFGHLSPQFPLLLRFSYFMVARLNGESPHIQIKKLSLNLATFISQTHYTVQSSWLKNETIYYIAWSHFQVPFISKKEMTLNIQPVTKFTLFQLRSPFSRATINRDFAVQVQRGRHKNTDIMDIIYKMSLGNKYQTHSYLNLGYVIGLDKLLDCKRSCPPLLFTEKKKATLKLFN